MVMSEPPDEIGHDDSICQCSEKLAGANRVEKNTDLFVSSWRSARTLELKAVQHLDEFVMFFCRIL